MCLEHKTCNKVEENSKIEVLELLALTLQNVIVELGHTTIFYSNQFSPVVRQGVALFRSCEG